MNERLDAAARALFSLAFSSDKDGKEPEMKTLEEYRKDAAPVLLVSDKVLFSEENVRNAIINAGYEPAEYLEQFLKVAAELQNAQPDAEFTLADMKKAWSNGHEEGFWDARMTDKSKPEPVATTAHKEGYTKADVKRAEAEGYKSGWDNGILSQTDMPEALQKVVLLGSKHAFANNPYSDLDIPKSNAAVREGTEGHAMWCAGSHEGECSRGRVTGTEKSGEDA